MKNNRRSSLPQQPNSPSPRIQAIEKGGILKEIDRMKNLDTHHKRINNIINGDLHKRSH